MNSIVAVLALVALIAGPSPVEAQRSGGTTTGSGTGSTAGSTSTTSGNTSGSTLGTTAGTSSGGAARQSGGPTGQGVMSPQLQAFGTTQNQNTSGFLGTSSGNTFIGQQQAAQQNARGGLGAQFGAFGANQGTGTAARGTGQTTTRSRAERLRPQHRVAFSFTPVNTAVVNTRLQAQIRPLQAGGRLGDVVFAFDGDGTLTLQGTAGSIDDRELAAAVARLEPGVVRIDNQMVVPQAISAPAAFPAGLP